MAEESELQQIKGFYRGGDVTALADLDWLGEGRVQLHNDIQNGGSESAPSCPLTLRFRLLLWRQPLPSASTSVLAPWHCLPGPLRRLSGHTVPSNPPPSEGSSMAQSRAPLVTISCGWCPLPLLCGISDTGLLLVFPGCSIVLASVGKPVPLHFLLLKAQKPSASRVTVFAPLPALSALKLHLM